MRFLLISILFLSNLCLGQQTIPERVDGNTPADVQMQLITEAAPPDVVEHATIYILGAGGYQKTRVGTNGFSCLVLRERTDTIEPECYDAEGSATLLKADLYLEQQRAKGRNDEAIKKEIAAGYKSGRFKAPRKPGIVYMLSPHNRVFDPESQKVVSFPGHLMFYAPYATAKTVGAGKGAPYIVHSGEPDALLIVVPASMN